MLRTGILVLAGLAFAAFVAGNWGAFTASTVLTFGLFDFVAPLGVLLLAALVAVTLIFLATMAVWQARILGDTRRHTRELNAQRALADNAEASRLVVLREQLERRIEAAEVTLRSEMHDGFNSVAAMVGEMDDRLGEDVPLDPTLDLPPRGSRH